MPVVTRPAVKFRSDPPWYFKLVRHRIMSGRRGGYLGAQLLRRLGALEQICAFPLLNGERIFLPLSTTGILESDVLAYYERDAIAAVASVIDAMPEPPVFVDAGADTGVYTRLLCAQTRFLNRVLAVEPNPRSYLILNKNLHDLSVPVETVCGALAEKSGRGALVSPNYDSNDRAKFVESCETGDIQLYTVDELLGEQFGYVALKVDVEGAELQVLQGAQRTLSNCLGFVVQFEAHPDVSSRTGVDPMQAIRLLQSMAELEWLVCDEKTATSSIELHPERPFFEQYSKEKIYDVVVWSKNVNGQTIGKSSLGRRQNASCAP